MKFLSLAERAYVYNHLNRVRHITLDPNGPGAVRIHLVPCRKPDRTTPFVAILNGQDILPLQISWAILLASLMDALQPFAGKEISPADWDTVQAQAVAAARKIYRRTPSVQIESDLQVLLDCLLAIAQGKTPPVSVQPMRLGDYAARMAAPHRMDLMISAMTKDGAWHCNQKCLHCYAACQPLAEVPELDTDQWLAVIEKCRNAGIPQLTFTGGEPTLRSDLVKLVQAAQWFVTRLNTTELTEALRPAMAFAAEHGLEINFTSPGWLSEDTLTALGFTQIPSCGACLSNMAIAPDGTVLPCQSWLSGQGLGNILHEPWQRIWDSASCRTVREESARMKRQCQLGDTPLQEGC